MRAKYPRTFHLPWSLGATDDDKMHTSTQQWQEMEVVVTEKMDGENTTIYPDGYTHARSLDSGNHPSRNWVRALAARIATEGFPANLRICGENLYAKHSLGYSNLPAYFLMFSIWDGDTVLSWDETEEWAKLLDIPTVPVLYRGVWNENVVKSLMGDPDQMEGYVVRPTASFDRSDFSRLVGKFVRGNHVQAGSTHWAHATMVVNKLA